MSENAFVSEMGGTLTPNHGVEPAELVADEIDNALEQFRERAQALIKSANERKIDDNDSIGRAADTRSMIDALAGTIWARAKDIAAPHTRASQLVKSRTENFIKDLVDAEQGLKDRIDEFRRVQRQRASEQAKQQREQEAQMRAAAGVEPPQEAEAPAKPQALPSVQGDYGSRVSDRAVKTYSYDDVRALPDQVLNAPAVQKAIQTALRAYARLVTDIPGVKTTDGVETSHRRPN